MTPTSALGTVLAGLSIGNHEDEVEKRRRGEHSRARGADGLGSVYRMNDADKEALKQREQGYREISVRVWLKDGENFKVQPAFTFIGEQVCSSDLVSRAYLNLVLEGAE